MLIEQTESVDARAGGGGRRVLFLEMKFIDSPWSNRLLREEDREVLKCSGKGTQASAVRHALRMS